MWVVKYVEFYELHKWEQYLSVMIIYWYVIASPNHQSSKKKKNPDLKKD